MAKTKQKNEPKYLLTGEKLIVLYSYDGILSGNETTDTYNNIDEY